MTIEDRIIITKGLMKDKGGYIIGDDTTGEVVDIHTDEGFNTTLFRSEFRRAGTRKLSTRNYYSFFR